MFFPDLHNNTITARARTCRPMPLTGPLIPFLRNGARATGGIGGRSGERTGNRPDQSRENALRELRHLDSSLPMTLIAKAQALSRSRIFNLRL